MVCNSFFLFFLIALLPPIGPKLYLLFLFLKQTCHSAKNHGQKNQFEAAHYKRNGGRKEDKEKQKRSLAVLAGKIAHMPSGSHSQLMTDYDISPNANTIYFLKRKCESIKLS